ncbi:MAG: hypothetical protein LBK29_04245 [Oscillospiraceae bacterium]|jgi:hypothetical protein|nr:hypothetical protein [Oscillospiraceae bacterium]
MIFFKRAGDYKILADMKFGVNSETKIGFKGKFPSNELFILNKFKHVKENSFFLKTLSIYFLSEFRTKDYHDFFSNNEHFYAIFKYKKNQNLNYRYNKNSCIASFDERLKVFENILIRTYNLLEIHKIPFSIISTVLTPENITVDENKNEFFNFDLHLLQNNKNADEKTIFKNISNIILSIFEIESSLKYNKILQIIIKKCKFGLYDSIPKLIIEFKKSAGEIKVSSFSTYWKRQIELRKYLIPKLTQMIMAPAMVVALVYLIYKKLNSVNETTEGVKPVVIGEISYSAGTQDTSGKNITLQPIVMEETKSDKEIGISLPPDALIEFDDYVVRKGDDIGSICETFYADKKFESAISGFNNLEKEDALLPGKILKLPNKASVAVYLENSEISE